MLFRVHTCCSIVFGATRTSLNRIPGLSNVRPDAIERGLAAKSPCLSAFGVSLGAAHVIIYKSAEGIHHFDWQAAAMKTRPSDRPGDAQQQQREIPL